jgi:hypothetical protein
MRRLPWQPSTLETEMVGCGGCNQLDLQLTELLTAKLS